MNLKSEHHLCWMLAFVQRKAVAKLDWKQEEEAGGERESEEAGEDFMQARLRFTLHGLRFIETIDVSNVPTASTNIHRGYGTRRQIFSGNHFGFQPAFELERDSPWSFPRFVPVCSWLGSRDSPSPAARIAHLVPFPSVYFVGRGIKRRKSCGDKRIHLCEIWHMSAPGLLWALSELFGAKLGAVGRLTNQPLGDWVLSLA